MKDLFHGVKDLPPIPEDLSPVTEYPFSGLGRSPPVPGHPPSFPGHPSPFSGGTPPLSGHPSILQGDPPSLTGDPPSLPEDLPLVTGVTASRLRASTRGVAVVSRRERPEEGSVPHRSYVHVPGHQV